MALELGEHPNYRVLERLQERKEYESPDGRKLSTGLIADCETTGLKLNRSKVIEVGLLRFEFDPQTGKIYRLLDEYGEFEDPGEALSPEIVELTHITDAMVAGKAIDDARVEQLLEGVDLVIAHNASFDRPFFERRFPVFEEVAWACSLEQVPWSQEGITTRKLEFLAYRYGFFFDGHRAINDCRALLELLARPTPKSGRLPLQILLAPLTQRDWTARALNSSFDKKELLKARGYFWDSERKFWHTTVTGDEKIKEEVAWLKEAIYGGREVELEFEIHQPLHRFSQRPGKVLRRPI